MKIYDVSRLPSQIVIGHGGENDWLPIRFDCSSLLEKHPDGVITLWLTPPGAAEAYPVALEREGNLVTWTPKNSELAVSSGRYQFRCQDGDAVGESDTVNYKVKESLAPGADHPAETPSWAVQVVADVTAQADRAEAAAESIDPESLEQTISEAIADYLEEHPVEVTETDPTVPAWAKQPQKPTYTASEVGALPADTPIPAAVTEQTVAGWGFTKNTGTYSKPSGGIPKTDLASDVQASLDKADSAISADEAKIMCDISVSGFTTGSAVTLYRSFAAVYYAYQSVVDCIFGVILARSGGEVTTALLLRPTVMDVNTTSITFVGEYNGNRYSTTLTAASADASPMTGTLVVEPLAELPAVSAADNGKFLRVVNGAWAAATVPSAESNSFGGGS